LTFFAVLIIYAWNICRINILVVAEAFSLYNLKSLQSQIF
jgi:hypothetical protein